MKRIALLHGAGYAGGDLIRLLLFHPGFELAAVTSRTFSGHPVWEAHPFLRGVTSLSFTAEEDLDLSALDGVLISAEHGQGVAAVQGLLDRGFNGVIVDLSADFRFRAPHVYEHWFGFEHPAPELLDRFQYGLPEVYAPYTKGVGWIANPGCFATGLSLALWPLCEPLTPLHVSVTALTGASGSGTKPKTTTHYPTREGNVRAYKVLNHQHQPEVEQVLGTAARLAFVPVSGPWVRGIWGTAHVMLSPGVTEDRVRLWYESAYAGKPFVRLFPGELPEMRASVGTPFCDIGWVVDGLHLVVGFALDNLLKGAASQAIQNLNLALGQPETAGLLPGPTAPTF